MEPRSEPSRPTGIDESGRQALRDDPDVIVLRPDPPVAFAPWVTVTGVDSVRDLIGRDDDGAADDEWR
jgi:hypothetical protein